MSDTNILNFQSEADSSVSAGTLPSKGFNDGIATDKFGKDPVSLVSSEFTGETSDHLLRGWNT